MYEFLKYRVFSALTSSSKETEQQSADKRACSFPEVPIYYSYTKLKVTKIRAGGELRETKQVCIAE